MKRFIKLFLIISFLLFMANCSGTNLSDQFFNSSGSETGALQVMAINHLKGGVAGELTPEDSKVVVNDQGYTIEITKALIHFHQLRLISEGDDPTCLAGFDQEIDLHSTYNLLGEDLFTHLLNTVIIPKHFFCQFELILGTEGGHDHTVKFAHGDGDGDHDHGTDGSQGGEEITETFHLQGAWEKDGEMGEFNLIGEGPLMVAGKFKTKENDEVIEHPIHFHDGEDVINIIFGTKYDEVFDGVDFKSQTEDEQIEKIFEQLGTAVHQHTGAHHEGADTRHDHN